MTKGQGLVGVTFNTVEDAVVVELKAKVAELIDYIDKLEGCPRRKAIAFTHLETGQMFAVKSLFCKEG